MIRVFIRMIESIGVEGTGAGIVASRRHASHSIVYKKYINKDNIIQYDIKSSAHAVELVDLKRKFGNI